ncbi:hypothetical protein LLG96_13260 [bacterium]|nr:hypothetical protein [bacterium]
MSALNSKRTVQISLLVLSVVLIAAGVMREEVFDVISNATILCFSCIGLK